MKIRGCAFAVPIFAVLAVILTGCVTSQYSSRTADSAYVRGIDRFSKAMIFMEERVNITEIDGLRAGQEFFGLNLGDYVPPGRHELDIIWGYHGSTGENFIAVDLAANHKYQFNISAGPSLTLIDETASSAAVAKVGQWNLSDEGYSMENDGSPIVDVDFGGAEHARPPLDRGDKRGGPGGGDDHNHPPPHSGGPPSIPHNPPPSHGGGGGGSGGGHSGGGGGGGGGGGNHSGGGGGGGSGHK